MKTLTINDYVKLSHELAESFFRLPMPAGMNHFEATQAACDDPETVRNFLHILARDAIGSEEDVADELARAFLLRAFKAVEA